MEIPVHREPSPVFNPEPSSIKEDTEKKYPVLFQDLGILEDEHITHLKEEV